MSLTSHSFEPGLLLNVPEARTSGKTISCLAFSPTGNIICAGFGNVLRFWDMAQPGFHILDYISWQDMNVTCIAWDNDGLHCGFNNGGYCTIVFDEDTWSFNVTGCWMGTTSLDHLAHDIFQDRIAVASGTEVTLWKRRKDSWMWGKSNEETEWQQMISGPTTDIANKSLDFTVTGMGWNRSKRNQIVICYLKHGILSWDVKTGQTVSFIPISHMSLAGLLSPAGCLFATFNQYGSVDIYDLRKGRFLHSYGSNREPGQIEDFNPSIQFFLSGTFLLRGGRGITTILRSDIHEDEFRSLSYDEFQQLPSGTVEPVLVTKILASDDGLGNRMSRLKIASILNDSMIAIHHTRSLGNGRNGGNFILVGLTGLFWMGLIAFVFRKSVDSLTEESVVHIQYIDVTEY